jgi:hypothetical protein
MLSTKHEVKEYFGGNFPSNLPKGFFEILNCPNISYIPDHRRKALIGSSRFHIDNTDLYLAWFGRSPWRVYHFTMIERPLSGGRVCCEQRYCEITLMEAIETDLLPDDLLFHLDILGSL